MTSAVGSVALALVQELRHALRRLPRSPAFAMLAICTLIVGIGINTAMFALLDAMLFRPPFHVAEPADVVRVQFRIEASPEATVTERTLYPEFEALRTSAAFAAVAAYTDAFVSIGRGAEATLANAMLVSAEFFDVLRPPAHIGNFVPGERGVADRGDRAVISHGLWQRHFGADPGALDAKLTIDGKIYSVAGVAPRGFQSLSARPVDIWLPLDHASISGAGPAQGQQRRGRLWLYIVGRLQPGASRAVVSQRATAALRDRRAALGSREPPTTVFTTSIVPGRDSGTSLESKVSLWLAGVSAFVLLIACANVSNLVLARAFAQRREYFIRLTLGASRWALVSRCLSDTCVLVVPAAVGALGISFLLRNGIAGFLPGDLPLSRDFWDVRTSGVLAGSAALAFTMLCVVSLSQLPSSMAATGLLGTNARNVRKGPRRTLLAVQAGLCLALLFIAGLFAASLRRAEALDLGVDVDRTIQVTVNLPAKYADDGETRAIYEQAHAILSAHPDVERTALTATSPYKSGSGAAPWTNERSAEVLWAKAREVAYRSVVGAGFFSAVGSQSLRGRDFAESDRAGAPPVAIINASLARYLWPSKEALGECMWLDDATNCVRIVGVLGGVWKFSALRRDLMAVYLPLSQTPEAVPGALFIRPRGDARKFLAQARSIVQTVRPGLPAARALVLREIVDPDFRPWRLGATVFSAFAAVALLIASIGLYGVVAISTEQRLKEIGIRMALGARWSHVIRVVVGEGVSSVAAGLFAGGVLVSIASRWLEGVLFQTDPTDAAVLVQTALLLFIVSAVAVTVPTIRALRTNPAKVLRAE